MRQTYTEMLLWEERRSFQHGLSRWSSLYLLFRVFQQAEYKRRRQDLEQRLEALDNQARQIEASVHQQMELVSLTSSITEFCQRVSRGLSQATFEQKRQLVELLI